MSTSLVAALERLRMRFGTDAAARKLVLLKRLARSRLASAGAVRRLHEVLCFMHAYADDAAVLAQVRTMLVTFAQRADLRAQRAALAGSGIAGTVIRFRFFAGQAQWLAQRWPRQLRLDRSDADAEARIARALPPLLTHTEAMALRELDLAGYGALDRLRGRDETDAVFLLRRIAAMPGDAFTREAFSDAVDASYELEPGRDTPSRTTAQLRCAPRSWRREPLRRERPDLRAEIARAPSALRRLSLADGQALVDLARGAMALRERSLEAFSFADARDAWLVDDGDGLAFGFVGVVAARRHAIAATYGSLTLRNGVPIGYGQADLVGASAALSFNTFETFRGAEAGYTFARWLAALRGLLGARSFTLEPYQIGHHNDEAIESGAWWFYAKLGFAPRHAATARLMREERARSQSRARYRTSPATLRELAERPLFFEFDPAQPRPLFALGALGLQVGAALSACGGADRQHAVDALDAEMARRCAVTSWRGWSVEQREAWRRLAPVLTLLDLRGWRADDRRALLQLARAKGGRSERDYLVQYHAHPRFDAALLRWQRAQGR
ncbi:MAG TPA: hypothetical protein VFU71_00270 [Burkholderiaceae bacterium]|nr:hypothetical protein [Burkholderiaceae bacterium]